MNKAIAMLLPLAMLLGLAACGNPASQAEQAPAGAAPAEPAAWRGWSDTQLSPSGGMLPRRRPAAGEDDERPPLPGGAESVGAEPVKRWRAGSGTPTAGH